MQSQRRNCECRLTFRDVKTSLTVITGIATELKVFIVVGIAVITLSNTSGHGDDVFLPNTPVAKMQFQIADSGSVHIVEANNTDEDIPIILWWTKRLGPKGNVKRMDCGSCQCYVTRNRKFLKRKKTRGILFYGSDLEMNDLPFPRKPHHEWALFHEESPMNNYAFSHQTFIKLFNHTATFRRESDYPLTTQNIHSLKYLTDRMPVPLHVKNSEKQRRNLAPVLYVQSHDKVASDRDRYVAELMKHVDIDSYGTSLHNHDLPENLHDPAESFEKESFLDFISVYKFHIAFENAICKDYMTEKLLRPVHVGSVPIYRGSSVANDWMPNNRTVIFADDFPSPQDLAQYISYLDNNDEEYEKYLYFKDPGGVTNTFLLKHLNERPWGSHNHKTGKYNEYGKVDYLTGFQCHLCRVLNERMQGERSVNNTTVFPSPKMANNSHMGCPQPYPSIGHIHDIPKDDPYRWHEANWVEMYWHQLDKAVAVRRMIEAGETSSSTFNRYLHEVMSKGVS